SVDRRLRTPKPCPPRSPLTDALLLASRSTPKHTVLALPSRKPRNQPTVSGKSLRLDLQIRAISVGSPSIDRRQYPRTTPTTRRGSVLNVAYSPRSYFLIPWR